MNKYQNNISVWKAITGRIIALWALLWFVATMLIAIVFYLPCFFLGEPKKSVWHRAVSRVWMRFYLALIGCPIHIYGKEHYQHNTNYIIVCNHNSLLDIPVSTPFFPAANKTIAKKSFARIPLFGWIYSFGSVLVDRKNDQSKKKSYEEMKKVLAQGIDMLIYPEGTRNRTNDPLKSFYDGAFRLAADTGKPILPAVLFHTRSILPVNHFFYLMPHKIEMHILPPVMAKDISVKELKEKVFTLMWNYYNNNTRQD